MKACMLIALTLALGSVATDASAGVFKKGAIACFTSDALDEATQAGVNNDRRQFAELFKTNQCIVADGLEFSIVKLHWTVAEVRIYLGDVSGVLWTHAEYALER